MGGEWGKTQYRKLVKNHFPLTGSHHIEIRKPDYLFQIFLPEQEWLWSVSNAIDVPRYQHAISLESPIN